MCPDSDGVLDSSAHQEASLVRYHLRMADSTPSKLAQKQDEPLFMAIPPTDLDFQSAYERAAATIPAFIEHIQRGDDPICSTKLRFRDPDEFERLGEDRFAFIWLTGVQYHAAERVFSGTFFEVPPEFQKWHQVGQRLGFDGEDIFDWMVLTSEGRLFGGYSLRVTRSRLPESERVDYDRYIGVTAYEPDA
jgi:uncharacterized protein YegJ (DUF2314 family)